jgi:hypothetical protein
MNTNRVLSPILTDPSSKQSTSIQKEGELSPLGIYSIFTPFLSSFLIGIASQSKYVKNAGPTPYCSIPSSIPSSPLSLISSNTTPNDKDLDIDGIQLFIFSY